MGLLPKRMRNNPVSAASSAPSFAAMIERINAVKAGDVPKLSNPRSVSPAMRLSLATFLEEWTESDVGHEKYLENVLTGFDGNEAIKMGDLLEWMAIGTDKQFDNEVSMPKGVDHKELVCLHAELLDFLPLKSYNTFTMVTLLEDDPELVEEVFNNYVELTATEHDALQALSTIVKRGSVESIRLFLEASPKHSEKGYGFTQTNNYGSLLVDTFELCRRASVAYKDGNYMGAKALLGQLFDEKGIDAELVRMDLSKMAPMVLEIAQDGGRRGPGDLVLVSPMYAALEHKNLSSAKAAKSKGDQSTQKADVEFVKVNTGSWGAEIIFEEVGSNQKFRIKRQDKSKSKEENTKIVMNTLNKLLSGAKGVDADDIVGSDDSDDRYILTVIGKQIKEITAVKRITGGDEEGDDEEEMLMGRATTETSSSADDKKITEQGVVELIRKLGNVVQKGGGGGGNNNNNKNKTMFPQCKAKDLLTAIYNRVEQGTQAVFIIHATLSRSPNATAEEKAKFKPDSNLIPKGTVTFTANRKNKADGGGGSAGIHVNMVIEMLPGHEADRSPLVRDTVDPLDKAIEGADAETRRNPIEPPLKRDKPRFTHRYYPATMKKYRKDAPWVFPGQTMSGLGVEMFREATQGIPGQNIQDNELYFDMQMDGRPDETDVYVEDGSRFRYIGTIKSVLHRGKLGKSPKNNPHHGQGPFSSETLARSVAKVMAEDGEDVYMWYCGRSGGWMVSQDHPTDVPANEVRKFTASSKPKKNPKGPGKKRTSAVGNTYAIDLIPRSSVKLTKKDVKFSNKILHKWRDTSAEMKAFWKKYTSTGSGGGSAVYIAEDKFVTKNGFIRMKKGQTWNNNRPPIVASKKEELKEMLEARNKSRKGWLGSQMKYLIRTGKLIPDPNKQQPGETGGSYVTYKGGKVSMRMILARHKQSGSLVPYRLFVPAAAFRMEGDTLVPRSGSGDTKGAKQLLDLIENSFGKISFHKNMGKGGLEVGKINVDKGVAKVFKTGGLKTEGGAVARPYLFDDKRLTYIAKGRQYTMELA